MRRVLVCANPNLNLIDGSSVWVQSIALAIASIEDIELHVLCRITPRRFELLGPLRDHPRIKILSAPDEATQTRTPSNSYDVMLGAALALDDVHRYSACVFRGIELCRRLDLYAQLLSKAWIYITDFGGPGILSEAFPETEAFQLLASKSERILYQTEEIRALWLESPCPPALEKMTALPPLIPAPPTHQVAATERDYTYIYAGKFSPLWMTLEMVKSWGELASARNNVKFIAIGDKFHDDDGTGNFERAMRAALTGTPNLLWLGAQSRSTCAELMTQAKIGLSFRDSRLDHSAEISTKIIEYGAAGCAVIMNRTPMHESKFGADYPLFANSISEFKGAMQIAQTSPAAIREASKRLEFFSRDHRIEAQGPRLGKLIRTNNRRHETLVSAARKKRFIVAGHDLKFFKGLQKQLEATGQFEFQVDKWSNHSDSRGQSRRKKMLEQADGVICEWALGNLEWYSHHILPHQKLVSRFHLQEQNLPYLWRSDWGKISRVVFVSETLRQQTLETLGFPDDKTRVISNYLDRGKFFPQTKNGDAKFCLGLIGYVPKRKRLDRALDLLELLLKKNNRYNLRVKGHHPLGYSWIADRGDERAYYEELFFRINSSPTLRYKVVFDGAGDDINDWLTLVGHLVSPSDFESFHMAIGEAILTGTQPVIWDWAGAKDLWGDARVVGSAVEAAQRIHSAIEGSSESGSNQLPSKHEPADVVKAWQQLLLEAEN